MTHRAGDSDDVLRHVEAQLTDRRQAYQDSLAQAQQSLQKAEHERESGLETLDKLRKTNPIYKTQAESYADLGKDGYAPQVLVNDKEREYLENTQELRSQEARVASLSSAVAEAQKQVSQITSKYRADLQNERIDAAADQAKLEQEMAKHTHQTGLLELRASEGGIVKDLATHTIGTVVSAGTVLLSLVPENEPVVAEVVVRNEDVGFVRPDQSVKVKVASYPFQKYGMIEGKVRQVWPDSTDGDTRSKSHDGTDASASDHDGAPAGYKALIDLKSQTLSLTGHTLRLVPGMRVIAEINQGRRSVLEYLLSPVQKVAQEGGRER
jgi:HlyD family secretion protein